MERTSADAWTRIDPVFNEGTPVEGRVALQLQIMSDQFARVRCSPHGGVWAVWCGVHGAEIRAKHAPNPTTDLAV